MKRGRLLMLLLGICIAASGCATVKELTPLERRAIESRDLNSSYDNAYRATLTVLQDKGYKITNSDYQGGVVSGTTEKQTSAVCIKGPLAYLFDISQGKYNSLDITITLEKYTDAITKMRLVITQHMYDEYNNYIGAKRIEKPEALQEYYSLIQKEIFMREQLER